MLLWVACVILRKGYFYFRSILVSRMRFSEGVVLCLLGNLILEGLILLLGWLHVPKRIMCSEDVILSWLFLFWMGLLLF